MPAATAAALDDPFAQLRGPLAGTTRMRLEVAENTQLTPHMQRLVLTAPELAGFDYRPGQDVMLLVAADGRRPLRRRYTIRALDPGRRLLTLDIVRHGDGPGEQWVRSARPGDTIEGIGPRGKIFVNEAADWHLFAADESGLAAVLAMAGSLPAGTRAIVFLEVPEPADQQDLVTSAGLSLHWLPRSAGAGAPSRAASRPRATRRRWPRRWPPRTCRAAAGTPTCSARQEWCSGCVRCSRNAAWSRGRSRRRPTGAAAGRTRSTASPARDE